MESLNAMEDKYGYRLEYDANWGGPIQRRSCTDVFWLILFIAAVTTWCGIGYYAVTNGSVEMLLAPVDSAGRRCGFDYNVTEKKYLVFFDTTKCISVSRRCNTPQVCVSKCPEENFDFYDNYDSPIETLRAKMICLDDVQLANASREKLWNFVNVGRCASSYWKSTSFMGRCIPSSLSENVTAGVKKTIQATSSSLVDATVISDLKNARYIILTGCLASVIVSILYVVILWWMTTGLVIAHIIVIFSTLVYAVCATAKMYAEDESSVALLAIALISLIVFTLLIIYLHRRIYLSCQLIQEGSRAMTQVLSTLLVPFFPWLLQAGLVACTVWVQLSLASLPSEMDSDGNWYSDRNMYLHIVNIIVALWMCLFIEAVAELTLAGVFATWYWTFKKSDVPFFIVTKSFWRTVRYHLGTAAIGSLIVTLCKIIRYIYYFIASQRITRIVRLVKCYCTCFGKFLSYVHRSSYVICATYGNGYCSSALTAFNLIMRNVGRVLVIKRIITWLLFQGQISICALIVFAVWWYCSTEKDITDVWLPTMIVLVGSYVATSHFFTVTGTAIDTIVICFLEDCERNDGSITKPFYMSKGLGKILLR